MPENKPLDDHSLVGEEPENEPLYDHSPVGKREGLCKNIQKRIDDGSYSLINLLDEKEQKDSTKPKVFDNVFVKKEGKETLEYRTQKYIGLLEYEGEQIIITSRFDKVDKENPRPFFLWYLIENFLGKKSMISLESAGGTCQNNLFDVLLIVRLIIQLQHAYKKGGLRAYNRFNRNDSKVSGTIDVARHIRENLDLENGRMAYRIQAYSLDNPWNILFLQACAAARKRFPDLMRRLERRFPEFSAALQTLAQAVPGWEEANPSQILGRTKWSITNPIYRDWESVRIAARAVLRRMGIKPDKSGAHIVTGVLLDINRLWERLLEDKLFFGAKEPFSQRPKTVLNGHVEIKPDFYFKDQKTVLDAKNRPVWEKTLPDEKKGSPDYHKKGSPEKWSEILEQLEERPDAVRDNIYQILSYMLTLDCSQGGVVFPANNHCKSVCDPVPVSDPIGPPGQFWRIPVRIPQAKETYKEFRDELNEEFVRLRGQRPVDRLITK